MQRKYGRTKWASRRNFLAATSALAVASTMARANLPVLADGPKRRFRRFNLADPQAAPHLTSYEAAISAMLELPPENPLNWYRMALIHLMDCPHGNWWFLPWHRGFLGYFELICRKQSGDTGFALPYWDWTANPSLPASFVDGKLNPAHFAIEGVEDFRKKFEAPVQALWNSLTNAQKSQLSLRGISTVDILWKQIEGKFDPNDSAPMFPGLGDARMLNPPNSPLFDARTSRAVALSTILDALSPRDFVGFGSGKQSNHHEPLSGRPVFGVLEGQPHNLVHNMVGGYIQGNPSRQGFMTAFLSPTDPLFFMHHSNIDRLWDVWTRKQQAFAPSNPSAPIQYPTTPTGNDLAVWNAEPFLFYVDENGKPASKTKSGDFVSIGDFDYDYQPGSGEDVVLPTPPTLSLAANKSFAAAVRGSDMFPLSMRASVEIPGAVSAAAGQAEGVRVTATITAMIPSDSRMLQLHVLVNPRPDSRTLSLTDPSYAGSFELFGRHSHGDPQAHAKRPVTFTIGLTDSLSRLREAKRLKPGAPLDIHVVADLPGISLRPVEVNVTEVIVKSN